MPDLHPIVERLDESICETIPGLQYAVKWRKAYYGLPELGWIIELVASAGRSLAGRSAHVRSMQRPSAPSSPTISARS